MRVSISTAVLKWIAVFSMALDHSAKILGPVLGIDLALLEHPGRWAFPLFSFCLVQGWMRTHDRKRYMTRLLWLAVGSQLPFALTFQPGVSASFHIDLSFVSMALAGCALLFYLLGRNMGLSFWAALFSAALLPALRWTQNGVILLAPPLNVAYTLSLGLGLLYLWEQRRPLAILAAFWGCLCYGLEADYGYCLSGILLILLLRAVYTSPRHSGLLILLWSLALYGIGQGQWLYGLSGALAGLFVYFHDGSRGRYPAAFFYGFYPSHLLFLKILAQWL